MRTLPSVLAVALFSTACAQGAADTGPDGSLQVSVTMSPSDVRPQEAAWVTVTVTNTGTETRQVVFAGECSSLFEVRSPSGAVVGPAVAPSNSCPGGRKGPITLEPGKSTRNSAYWSADATTSVPTDQRRRVFVPAGQYELRGQALAYTEALGGPVTRLLVSPPVPVRVVPWQDPARDRTPAATAREAP